MSAGCAGGGAARVRGVPGRGGRGGRGEVQAQDGGRQHRQHHARTQRPGVVKSVHLIYVFTVKYQRQH